MSALESLSRVLGTSMAPSVATIVLTWLPSHVVRAQPRVSAVAVAPLSGSDQRGACLVSGTPAAVAVLAVLAQVESVLAQ